MSFIVRFYPALPDGQADWRGQVEHVQTGEKRPFRGAQQLVQIMESFFEPQAKEPNAKEVMP
ncbi:hypothetical protein HY230_06430 [Candidatus Acetothermia bacterium]|nr:hypothetical protein [Candidatus Acetothermia bacterium]